MHAIVVRAKSLDFCLFLVLRLKLTNLFEDTANPKVINQYTSLTDWSKWLNGDGRGVYY